MRQTSFLRSVFAPILIGCHAFCLCIALQSSAAPVTMAPPEPMESIDSVEVGMDSRVLSRIDDVMTSAIEGHETSGGVVLVARHGRVVFHKAFGNRSSEPVVEPATTDTIYDLASLTKVVASTSAIMKLVESGKIRLNSPVSTFIPEWKNSDEETSALAELSRFRRSLRSGGTRLGDALLQTSDFVTTASGSETSAPTWERYVREGKIRVSDKFLSDSIDFGIYDRTGVSLRHLLTHTSGLEPFDNYYLKMSGRDNRKAIIADIASRKLRQPPGQGIIYSDFNFILLGEIVERVSGKPLDQFCHDEVFAPLGMNDTMFNPPAELKPRIAPTEWRAPRTTDPVQVKAQSRQEMIRGEVHDGNAWVQNGVSGHAGLFSTASDLAVFCQMLLNEGQYRGLTIFSPLTVRAMTSDHARLETGEKRGYGWDIRSGYSGQRGDLFASGFGHTGWTGTSLWIVPDEQVLIVILTNRVHPDGTGDAGPLRAKIANIVATSIEVPFNNPIRRFHTDSSGDKDGY